jgi:ABC-type oligopeptide transport system substrate-binding subunit
MKTNEKVMIGLAAFLLSTFLLGSCSQEYYKTREGKAKQKYYNDIQFGRDAHPKKKF